MPIPGGFPGLFLGSFAMANVIVTVPDVAEVSEVIETRCEFVAALGSTYGAGRRYAATLIAFFRTRGMGERWVTMAHDHKGAEGDAMREERDALYTALREGGHSNPSVKWKQIKDHAVDLLKIESGEPEESTESGSGKKETRSVQLRMVEDLTSLYKLGKREKLKLTPAQAQAHTHIASALNALGVDISQL
jgi:hypothetical protein